MTDVCVCMRVQSLCANSPVVNCFDRTLTNEREKDKSKLILNTGWDFSSSVVSNLLTLSTSSSSPWHIEQARRSDFWDLYWKVHVYKMTLTECEKKSDGKRMNRVLNVWSVHVAWMCVCVFKTDRNRMISQGFLGGNYGENYEFRFLTVEGIIRVY